MKKFKTSAEKHQLKEENLSKLLAEKNLLRTAFLNYTHLPFGLLVTLAMLLNSWLVERPLLSMENALFVFLGIGMVAFFYMLQGYEAFARHRQQLANVRNRFVGSRALPSICGLVLLYMALPLGWPVFALTALLLLLALCYHLPLLGQPLKKLGTLNWLLMVVYMAATLWIPILAPNGLPGANAIALTVIALVILTGLSLRAPNVLLIETGDKLAI